MTIGKTGSFANDSISNNTTLSAIDVADSSVLFVQFQVSDINLTAFAVLYRTLGGNAPWLTMASTSGHYTTPTGVVLGASGDLTGAVAGATSHWLRLDVRGVQEVAFTVSGSGAGILGYYRMH